MSSLGTDTAEVEFNLMPTRRPFMLVCDRCGPTEHTHQWDATDLLRSQVLVVYGCKPCGKVRYFGAEYLNQESDIDDSAN